MRDITQHRIRQGWRAAVLLLWLGWRIANPAKEAAKHAAMLLLKST